MMRELNIIFKKFRACAARNYGFQKQRWLYKFFDSDDLAHNNHLSSAVEILKFKKLDFSFRSS